MTTSILEELYLDVYKMLYKDIIMSSDDSILLEEFKRFVEDDDNRFIEMFEQYKSKSFAEYEKESLEKEKLGVNLMKYFKGEKLTSEEINNIYNSSSKQKINAFELISFKNLRREKDAEKIENFMENDRIINNIKSFDVKENIDFSYLGSEYVQEITKVGKVLFEFYDGKILSDDKLKLLASTSDGDKVDSMFLYAPKIFNLREDENLIANFLENENQLEEIKSNKIYTKKRKIRIDFDEKN